LPEFQLLSINQASKNVPSDAFNCCGKKKIFMEICLLRLNNGISIFVKAPGIYLQHFIFFMTDEWDQQASVTLHKVGKSCQGQTLKPILAFRK
jgi:hypothetical protein